MAIALLLADDEPGVRSLLAARARHALADVTVLEAEDGAHALELSLRERPHMALLDVQMPRLDGIAAAITLRELQPQLPLALYTADPNAHRATALELRLPLFDKLDVDGPIRWLELQVHALVAPWDALTLECTVCGYGAARPVPPERCPMCQGKGTWIHRPARRLRRSA